ncbi:hypothetical protein [Nonomuraea solani]|uniref:hypothetical protein n=1 Tax=Nonomuraea solani TaxID=1144553 RepID=UPI0011AFF6D1|nr:hypothetical protein [Nonomuraea solani]
MDEAGGENHTLPPNGTHVCELLAIMCLYVDEAQADRQPGFSPATEKAWSFVDLEAEILDLKRRMQAFEADTYSKDDALTPIGATEAKTLIADVQTGITDDLGALGVEIAGLRYQTSEYFKTAHMQMMERLDALRSDMLHLELRFDQLLKDRQ